MDSIVASRNRRNYKNSMSVVTRGDVPKEFLFQIRQLKRKSKVIKTALKDPQSPVFAS